MSRRVSSFAMCAPSNNNNISFRTPKCNQLDRVFEMRKRKWRKEGKCAKETSENSSTPPPLIIFAFPCIRGNAFFHEFDEKKRKWARTRPRSIVWQKSLRPFPPPSFSSFFLPCRCHLFCLFSLDTCHLSEEGRRDGEEEAEEEEGEQEEPPPPLSSCPQAEKNLLPPLRLSTMPTNSPIFWKLMIKCYLSQFRKIVWMNKDDPLHQQKNSIGDRLTFFSFSFPVPPRTDMGK